RDSSVTGVQTCALPIWRDHLLRQQRQSGRRPMNLRIALPAMLALALAGATTAHAQKLTGFAAWSKVVGNTVTAKVDGKDLVEHYTGDGVVKHMEGGSKVTTG